MPSELKPIPDEEKSTNNDDADKSRKRLSLWTRKSTFAVDLGTEVTDQVTLVNDHDEEIAESKNCCQGHRCQFLTAPRSIFAYNVVS